MIKFLVITVVAVAVVTPTWANTEIVERSLRLLSNGEFDAAADLINAALKDHPESAPLHHAAGNIFGAQAQNASLFAAPGYAKKTLKSFKEAVRLEPDNAEYRMGLMAFYLMAPGIVGGDDELGKAEATKIKELGPAMGFLAAAMVYQSGDEDDKLKAHYKTAEEQFPRNAEIMLNHALYYVAQEQFQLAHEKFLEIPTLELDEGDTHILYQAHYQLGRNSLTSKTNLNEGISALELFLDQAPSDYRLPPKARAKFRLASLMAEAGDNDKARALMTQAKR